MLLSTMDSQLEAVRQDIRDVKDEIVEVKQKLAAAEQAHNVEKEQSLLKLLSGLQNQLSGLQEEKTILLRNQAPSKLDLVLALLCHCSISLRCLAYLLLNAFGCQVKCQVSSACHSTCKQHLTVAGLSIVYGSSLKKTSITICCDSTCSFTLSTFS